MSDEPRGKALPPCPWPGTLMTKRLEELRRWLEANPERVRLVHGKASGHLAPGETEERDE